MEKSLRRPNNGKRNVKFYGRTFMKRGRKASKETSERNRQMLEDYKGGMRGIEVAEKYNLNRMYVYHILALQMTPEEKVKYRKSLKGYKTQLHMKKFQEWARLYREGLTVKQIAVKYGYSFMNVKNGIKRAMPEEERVKIAQNNQLKGYCGFKDWMTARTENRKKFVNECQSIEDVMAGRYDRNYAVTIVKRYGTKETQDRILGGIALSERKKVLNKVGRYLDALSRNGQASKAIRELGTSENEFYVYLKRHEWAIKEITGVSYKEVLERAKLASFGK